jgi:hypothetical protein
MTGLTGRCMCGAVAFVATGDPRFAIICQCRECQRNTGSGNAAQVAVDRKGFSYTGSPTDYARSSASGNTVTKAFCAICGCPLWGMTTRMEDTVMIMAGALDDPSQITPDYLVFSDKAQPWDHAALPAGT